MFVKVLDAPNERWINSDAIEDISFTSSTECTIFLRGGRCIYCKAATVRVFLEFIDTSPAISLAPVLEIPPLTTRLAQYLRDSAPHGATLVALQEIILESDLYTLPDALRALQSERVIVTHTDGLYYHASHLPLDESGHRRSSDF